MGAKGNICFIKSGLFQSDLDFALSRSAAAMQGPLPRSQANPGLRSHPLCRKPCRKQQFLSACTNPFEACRALLYRL